MAEVTIIGKLLEGGEERDAIHVAVAPVIAGERLRPGQHIGFYEGSDDREKVKGWLQGGEHAIGIVDPFLSHQAEKGERFWMFLYQHSITSLKHQWTHPAFGVEVRQAKMNISASEQWIRDYAEDIDVTYSTLMNSAANWLETGEYLNQGGTLEGVRTSDEFWIHYERVTGKQVDADSRDNFFTCSC